MMSRLLYTQIFVSFFVCLFYTGAIAAEENGGYLFAHMVTEDYGRLYYSISRDGINWKIINGGKRIRDDYRGHPDICEGPFGYYFMIVVADTPPSLRRITIWRTTDFITWTDYKTIPNEVLDNVSGYKNNESYYGAPKMFYDNSSSRFLITWHMTKEGLSQTEQTLDYWQNMRTFYIVSTDLVSFSQAKRLFNFEDDFPTIDVIIRKENNMYYAIMKDERWNSPKGVYPGSSYGKTIRISKSSNLEGPYGEPGFSLTPFGYEAHMLAKKTNASGWYLYAEKNPGLGYTISDLNSLDANSFSTVENTSFPSNARHGSVIKIDESIYNNLILNFDNQLGLDEGKKKKLR